MTPAIDIARKSRISFKVHEYSHDPASESYGDEAAEKLAVPQEQVFKTLVVSLDGKELAVGIIPVSSRLSLKLIAKALGAKKAAMAAQSDVERVTGYVLGGVSPLGQKKRLRTIIDTSATYNPTVFISAGRRGLDMELAPEDLKALVSGEFVKIT
ncbi:Cys-tRNA(Pro) deacylase [Idiomarina sp. PL1-037]|uniref:Cys-tRNA(Pro) deacylase n=1 Tax=Idiomarina sp. PL1-037 TaxID=3095365 RepID=UPI002ACC13B9|nr:Cys-tRNA(Pro) deacylase [Idiomarina sp. PL1-037]WQC53290.1 Cys-tRNA(Pro) deacylase [Idiomarina sp. PL1-037]